MSSNIRTRHMTILVLHHSQSVLTEVRSHIAEPWFSAVGGGMWISLLRYWGRSTPSELARRPLAVDNIRRTASRVGSRGLSQAHCSLSFKCADKN